MTSRFALAFIFVLSAAAGAQTPATPTPAATGPDSSAKAQAVRAARAPVIDGREDDPVWRNAPVASDFQEFQPTEGKAPRYRTEFKAAYDDRNLYVFVRAFDPHPDSIMTALTRRDVRGPSDQLKLLIDSYHDRRSGFEFAVNPLGVKRDYAMYNDQDEDETWDGIWDVGTRIDSVGWTAEFRIPFSQLRYANLKEHTFGFGVWRDIERYKERTSWPLYRGSQGGISSQLGVLEGIRDITPFRRLEVTPYAVAKSSSIGRATEVEDVTDWGRTQKVSLGADVKYGITPNLTLDATVNPDFGQVEADPSVVNLSAFESFFQERRPFFIEGGGLYQFNLNCSIVNCWGEGLFYSRRIGRSPQLGFYADESSPNVTPILGAAKLTGRLPNGFNIGVLEAVTGRVTGALERTMEPRTSYTVLRAQQELRKGNTSFGLIATGVNRALDSWSENFLRRQAYATGLNMTHRWGKSRYEATASISGSTIRGSEKAIARTQLNPAHLYQRPDGGLDFDSTRTSLSGDAEEVSFGKMGGNMIRFQTSWQRQSPGYEVNDLGYQRRANHQLFNNWMGLNWRKPTKYYRMLSGNFNAWGFWTAGGMPTERALNTNWHMNLPNSMWLHAGSTMALLAGPTCDNCARGGPAVRLSPSTYWNVGMEGDDRRSWVPFLFVSGATGDHGVSGYIEVSPEVQLRPLPQLQVDLSASWQQLEDDAQWLDNFSEGGITHYAFARLEQETRSLGVRVSYTLSTTLSFQLYAAPFLSTGQFTNVRELSATPRAEKYAERYVPYTPPAGTPMGFNVAELRSNSVLRWEFQPGSTVFAVWQHGREGRQSRFRDQSWNAEYRDLFSLHPANTFLIKVAYLLD